MDIVSKRLLNSTGSPAEYWTYIGSTSSGGIIASVPFTINFPTGTRSGDTVVLIEMCNAQSVPLNSGWSNAVSPWVDVLVNISSSSNHYVSVKVLPTVTSQTSITYSDTSTPAGCVFMYTFRPFNFNPSNYTTIPLINDISTYTLSGYSNSPQQPTLVTNSNQNYIITFASGSETGNLNTTGPGVFSNNLNITDSTNNGEYATSITLQKYSGTISPGNLTNGQILFPILGTISLRAGKNVLGSSVQFSASNVYLGGLITQSSTITIYTESSDPINITISGGNNSQFQINGGSWVTSGKITNGSTLTLQQTSVTGTLGTTVSSTATVTIGSISSNWTLNTVRGIVLKGTTTADVSQTIVVPTGLTSMSVVGTGGGGGGGAPEGASPFYSGGGGGGGAMSITPSLSVSAGQTLVITAGRGGSNAGSVKAAGGNGGNSTIVINGTTVWKAEGGKGGAGGNSLNPVGTGLGGVGGAAANSIGTTTNSGGNGGYGGNGRPWNSGSNVGGGGAGGYTGAGGAGGNQLVYTGQPSNIIQPGSAGSGGAAGGGAGSAQAGCGGGGTGVSGAGASGSGSTGTYSPNNVGSPDAYATSGGSYAGGTSGGGGCGNNLASNYGGPGVVRLVW